MFEVDLRAASDPVGISVQYHFGLYAALIALLAAEAINFRMPGHIPIKNALVAIKSTSVAGPIRLFADDLIFVLRVWRTRPWLPVCCLLLAYLPTMAFLLALAFSGLLYSDWATVKDTVGAFVTSGLVPLNYQTGLDVGVEMRPLTAFQLFLRLPVAGVLVAGLVYAPIMLFAAGWAGTERIWYLRAYRGKAIRLEECWKLTWAFAIRYATLGLLIYLVQRGVPLLVDRSTLIPSIAAVLNRLMALVVIMIINIGLLWIVVYAALTFVTPALAYSTRGVVTALAIGWQTLRHDWPVSAPYALVPPFIGGCLLILQELLTLDARALLVVSAVGTLLNLWFTGAIAAYYLRRHGTADNGAA